MLEKLSKTFTTTTGAWSISFDNSAPSDNPEFIFDLDMGAHNRFKVGGKDLSTLILKINKILELYE